MRLLGILVLLSGWIGAAMAEKAETWNRTLIQFGVVGTVAESGDWSRMGWGLSVRPYFYLDPSKPEGLYVGVLSGALGHSTDGITLADTRLVSLGWRGNPLALAGQPLSDFQADFSVAPTLGTRISGNSILGSTYTGIGFTFGLYIPILDWGDLGLSWEPTVNLATFGAPDIPEKSYSDFVLYWTMKSYTKTTQLPWR